MNYLKQILIFFICVHHISAFLNFPVNDFNIFNLNTLCNFKNNQSSKILSNLKLKLVIDQHNNGTTIINDDVRSNTKNYQNFNSLLKIDHLTILIATGMSIDSEKFGQSVVFALKERFPLETTNYIVVNWNEFNGDFTKYPQLASNAVNIGWATAQIITHFIQSEKMSTNKMYFLGISLGAHIAGNFGKTIFNNVNSKIKQIIAMDPASPCFSNCKNKPINKNDAQFVQVIHTDAGYLGMYHRVGHIDWLINSGFSPQPNCTTSSAIDSHVCSHVYSFTITALSAKLDNKLYGLKCKSYGLYKNNLCANNTKLNFGLDLSEEHFTKTENHGIYCVTIK